MRLFHALCATLGALLIVSTLPSGAYAADGPTLSEAFVLTKDGQLVDTLTLIDPSRTMSESACQPYTGKSSDQHVEFVTRDDATVCHMQLMYTNAESESEFSLEDSGEFVMTAHAERTLTESRKLFHPDLTLKSLSLSVEGEVQSATAGASTSATTYEGRILRHFLDRHRPPNDHRERVSHPWWQPQCRGDDECTEGSMGRDPDAYLGLGELERSTDSGRCHRNRRILRSSDRSSHRSHRWPRPSRHRHRGCRLRCARQAWKESDIRNAGRRPGFACTRSLSCSWERGRGALRPSDTDCARRYVHSCSGSHQASFGLPESSAADAA